MIKNGFDIADFHSHVIPGADHGSSSTSESLAQLELASSYGIKRIVATSHFYPEYHSVASFLSARDAGYERLLQKMPDGAPEIRLGAEVLICNGIERLPELEKLFIHGTSTLLLELPFADFQQEYCDSVYTLVRNGVDVLLAHADRYDRNDIERLVDNGARIQLNADSLSGFFKKKHLYEWMERGIVVALGSDIHGSDKNAYKRFVTAIDKIGVYAEYIKEESDKIWNNSKKF